MKKIALALASTALLAACDAAPRQEQAATPAVAEATGTATGAAAAGPQTPAQRAYAQANQRMHQGMAQIPADPDVAFMQGMLAHHRGAVEMSEVALAHAKDPQVRDLAQRVIAAQTSEIDEMTRWLNSRGVQSPPAMATGSAAPADHSAH